MESRFMQYLNRVRRDQRGITGVETAIILIAFVVVASVFAYTVLSAGIFSSEKSREAITAGVDNARSTMALAGGIVVDDTGQATNSTASDDQIDQLHLNVTIALEGELIDLTATVDSDNDGTLDDETGRTHTTIISYLDQYQRVDDIAWTAAQNGKGDGDTHLEANEEMRITINLSQLATPLSIDTEFVIEIKPNEGAAMIIERKIGPAVDDVMYLN